MGSPPHQCIPKGWFLWAVMQLGSLGLCRRFPARMVEVVG